ncbi:Elongator complex protein 5 [Apodospora peruviana]|uniref:Elongator complex protein 5 n=1 Tax=Apodospora peruviana TaxID=516989 RepID=A0AAE0MBM8_9PEZI|nr:Elongator complex protein 5 [Apodospora peruviana]
MAPSAQAHKRSHSLLLLQKLLNLRDSASPLTIILDSLEQSAGPLVHEFIHRAKIVRSKVVFVSFATVKKPHNTDHFIKARGKSLKTLAAEIASQCAVPRAALTPKEVNSTHKYLIIIDSLNLLASRRGGDRHLLPAFFSEIISPVVSLVAVYHNDVPIATATARSEYDPHPLTLLSHLATAVFRVSSLYQAVEAKRARERSIQEPEFGLREGREGVLIGLKRGSNVSGIVIEMEMRRRSGRAVAEKFVLVPSSSSSSADRTGTVSGSAAVGGSVNSNIMLLSDHPLFAPPRDVDADDAVARDGTQEDADSTFNLGLTDKQRRDREGVILPYFDAQTDIGAGEGGRILYEMGREDDFDDEEDEI